VNENSFDPATACLTESISYDPLIPPKAKRRGSLEILYRDWA